MLEDMSPIKNLDTAFCRVGNENAHPGMTVSQKHYLNFVR